MNRHEPEHREPIVESDEAYDDTEQAKLDAMSADEWAAALAAERAKAAP